MICPLKRSSERFLFCSATSSDFCAASRSAFVWSNWFCTSRVSSCTISAPGRTRVPVSTGISVICPDERDFTSTTLMGSMMPVASACTMIVRRSTAAVWMVSVASFFLPHAEIARAARRRLRWTGRNDTAGNSEKEREGGGWVQRVAYSSRPTRASIWAFAVRASRRAWIRSRRAWSSVDCELSTSSSVEAPRL